MKGLQDQNLPTRSNALYLTGLLFEQSPELQHHAPKVCELVLPLLKRETDPQALDNACGCVGRLIKSTHNLLDLPRVRSPNILCPYGRLTTSAGIGRLV